jgi:integrase/recombinase XerD
MPATRLTTPTPSHGTTSQRGPHRASDQALAAGVARPRRSRQRSRTLTELVEDYLLTHESEGHSPKTLEWHATALGLLLRFLEQEGVQDHLDLETHHLRRWVVWLGTPESQSVRPGRPAPRPRSKRTLHTYMRSAHAFGKWLVEERYTDVDVTEHFTLPKVGKPLIKILEEEDFAALLAAYHEG